MSKVDELIKAEVKRHEGERYYSYSINDLIKQDMIENILDIKGMTIKEVAELYGMSYGKTAELLRLAGIKARRVYTKDKVKEEKLPKMSQEEHEIAFWASSFNNGKLRYVYYDMIRRCYKKEDRGYPRYGARGITVCDEWKKDCKAFYRWAKENGYDKGLQIDRIDNDKGYYPENCRWVTPKENMMNRSNTRRITFNGQTNTLEEWSDITGISYQVLSDRIYRYGWAIERALTTDTKHDWIHSDKKD